MRHTGIVVSDLEKSLFFYKNLLGLTIIKRMIESSEYIDKILGLKKVKVETIKLAADDGGLIELLYFESHSCKSKDKYICDSGFTHVSFTVEDLFYEHKRLTQKGVIFNCAPLVSPDKKAIVAFCYDPENNFIELVQEIK